MFLGHYGVAYGAKSKYLDISLGTLFLASQWLDMLSAVMIFCGLERLLSIPGFTRGTRIYFDIPLSHSLVMALLWAVLFAFTYQRITRKSLEAAVVVGLVVFSHWILDFVVHYKDLSIYPGGSSLLGLGLWKSRIGTGLVEGSIFALGTGFYMKMSRSIARKDYYPLFLALLIVLISLRVFFQPPSPNLKTFVIVGFLVQCVLVIAAYWVDSLAR